MYRNFSSDFLEFLFGLNSCTDACMNCSASVFLHIMNIPIKQLLFHCILFFKFLILYNHTSGQIGTRLCQIIIEKALKMNFSININPVRRTNLFQILQFFFFEITQMTGHHLQCFGISVRILICSHHPDNFLLNFQALTQRLRYLLVFQKITDHFLGTSIITIIF